jgi:hypothetical protein
MIIVNDEWEVVVACFEVLSVEGLRKNYESNPQRSRTEAQILSRSLSMMLRWKSTPVWSTHNLRVHLLQVQRRSCNFYLAKMFYSKPNQQ